MKQITIIGNLGSAVVRRMSADGRELMTFNVAVNAGKSTQPVWFNCIGNCREALLPYLVKGQCVCVTGDLSARTYNGNIDLTVNVDRVELCGAAPKGDAAPAQEAAPAAAPEPTAEEVAGAFAQGYDPTNLPL